MHLETCRTHAHSAVSQVYEANELVVCSTFRGKRARPICWCGLHSGRSYWYLMIYRAGHSGVKESFLLHNNDVPTYIEGVSAWLLCEYDVQYPASHSELLLPPPPGNHVR